MLSIQQIAFSLALVFFASSVTASTECADWRSQFIQPNKHLPSAAKLISVKSTNSGRTRMVKRIYGDNSRVINSGQGACGNTFTDNDLIVLLWNGNKASPTGGWGSGMNRVNCNKKVYIQANGRGLYATIEDFGPMGIPRGDISNPGTLSTGCSMLWASQAVFSQLGANVQDSIDVQWDFESSWSNQPQGMNH